MKIARITATVLVFSLIAGVALAQPPGGGRGNRGNRGGQGSMMLLTQESLAKPLTDAIDKLDDLTSDQKDKIADLKKEFEPKFKDFHEKALALLTDDQKKALEDGLKKVKDATGRDRMQAVRDVRTAVNLTSDETTKLNAIYTDAQPVQRDARTKFTAILTDSQKAKMPQQGGRGNGRGRNRNGGGGNNQPQPQST